MLCSVKRKQEALTVGPPLCCTLTKVPLKYALFCEEEAQSWKFVSNAKPKPSVQHGPPSRPSPVVRGRLASATRSFARPGLSFADAVRSRPPPAASSSPNSTVEHLGVNRPPPLTGANAVPLPAKRSVFRRLQPPPVQRCPSLDIAPVNPARILQSLNDRLGDAALHPSCLRCLSNDHYRGQCKRPIRCHACLRWRHTADNCRFKSWTEERRFTVDGNMGRQISAISKKKKSGWSNPAVAGPSKTSPMAIGSGNERVQTRPQSSAWAAKGKEPAFNALPKPNTVQATARSSDPLLLSLGASPSTFPPSLTQENPALLQCNRCCNLVPACSPVRPSVQEMAYQRADPRPFLPPSFHWVDIPNREFMCRAVAPMRPPPVNEDLAIVTLDPLPGNVLNFGTVRNLIREFLISRHINPRGIMPCHLGQAYVRFHHAYERDQMVNLSPMVLGNVHISFVKHNEGRN